MAVQHILVVDDSKSARVMLTRLLQKGGMKVDLAESAEEGLDYLESSIPDLIFMDHMMPGMDGLEATAVIKKNSRTAGIPVVMYTSKEGDRYLDEVKSYGAMGVLPKPAKPSQIAAVLEQVDQYVESGGGVPTLSDLVVHDLPDGIENNLVQKVVDQAIEKFSHTRLPILIARTQSSMGLNVNVENRIETLKNTLMSDMTAMQTALSGVREKIDSEQPVTLPQVNDVVSQVVSSKMNDIEKELKSIQKQQAMLYARYDGLAEKIDVVVEKRLEHISKVHSFQLKMNKRIAILGMLLAVFSVGFVLFIS
jgi:CheY-like chemotaxis protein/chaperonin cofactor prefoldin